MGTRLLIASTDDANMRYATDLRIPDPFIWFSTGKNEFIVVSSLEYGRAQKECKRGVKVILLDQVNLDNIKKPIGRKRTMADIAASVLLSLNLTDVDIPANMWAHDLEVLREHGFRPRIMRPFFPQRSVKSAQEIKKIKETGAVAKKAMKRALQIIKDSEIQWDDKLIYEGEIVTSESLKFEIEKVFLSNGCISGESIVSCKEDSALPHHRGKGPLLAGQPIIIDIFPRSQETGYYFDMTRTVCKGTPSKELKRLYDTVKRAQMEALNATKPQKASNINAKVEEVFEKAGYKTDVSEGFIHSTGHGLGLEIHESPGIGSKSDDLLEKGNVITIEPGLYYKDVGGVRIEDTVVVTKDGHQNLTNFPKTFAIK